MTLLGNFYDQTNIWGVCCHWSCWDIFNLCLLLYLRFLRWNIGCTPLSLGFSSNCSLYVSLALLIYARIKGLEIRHFEKNLKQIQEKTFKNSSK